MQFEDWFDEREGWALRCERFYNHLDAVRNGNIADHQIIEWLRSAYEAGRTHMHQEMLETNGGTE